MYVFLYQCGLIVILEGGLLPDPHGDPPSGDDPLHRRVYIVGYIYIYMFNCLRILLVHIEYSVNMCIHTHMHTCIYIYIYTYIYTHIISSSSSSSSTPLSGYTAGAAFVLKHSTLFKRISAYLHICVFRFCVVLFFQLFLLICHLFSFLFVFLVFFSFIFKNNNKFIIFCFF